MFKTGVNVYRRESVNCFYFEEAASEIDRRIDNALNVDDSPDMTDEADAEDIPDMTEEADVEDTPDMTDEKLSLMY